VQINNWLKTSKWWLNKTWGDDQRAVGALVKSFGFGAISNFEFKRGSIFYISIDKYC
jgi:hypothetical protein